MVAMNVHSDNTPEEKDAGEYAAVYYVRVRCPRCDSKECPVYSTDQPVRYHRCADCGLRFKSVER